MARRATLRATPTSTEQLRRLTRQSDEVSLLPLSQQAGVCYFCDVLNVNTAVPEQGGPRVLGSLPPEANLRAMRAAARPTQRKVLMAWWLWPHVVSLDAPLVAIVWQHWWAQVAGVQILWFQDVILALGVWMIYLADRLADTRSSAAGPPETARHAFSARHCRILGPLVLGLVVSLAVLTLVELPGPQFAAGLGLLLIAGGYFWLIHRGCPSPWARFVPKEAFVGGIFAIGTTFFADGRIGRASWLVLGSTTLFALLCFFNCALITQWEATAGDRDDRTSLLNAFPRLRGRLGFGCMWLAALACSLALTSGSVAFLPLALGALALAWLDHHRAAFSAATLRVLADFALLAPLLWGGWMR